jgi:hypothetical protein
VNHVRSNYSIRYLGTDPSHIISKVAASSDFPEVQQVRRPARSRHAGVETKPRWQPE